MAAPTKDKRAQTFEAQPAGVKAALGVFAVAIVCAVYYFGLHMQLAEDLEAADLAYTTLVRQKTEAEQRQTEFLNLTQELANREAIDRQHKRVLPQNAEIAAFLDDLNRLAELNGLRFRTVEPRPEEAQELYVKLPVALSLNGRFHEIAKFFFDVSRLERAINMENVRLTQPTIEGENFILSINVLATTFRRPSDAEAAAEGAAAEGGH